MDILLLFYIICMEVPVTLDPESKFHWVLNELKKTGVYLCIGLLRTIGSWVVL